MRHLSTERCLGVQNAIHGEEMVPKRPDGGFIKFYRLICVITSVECVLYLLPILQLSWTELNRNCKCYHCQWALLLILQSNWTELNRVCKCYHCRWALLPILQLNWTELNRVCKCYICRWARSKHGQEYSGAACCVTSSGSHICDRIIWYTA